jgi:hypothetical protein
MNTFGIYFSLPKGSRQLFACKTDVKLSFCGGLKVGNPDATSDGNLKRRVWNDFDLQSSQNRLIGNENGFLPAISPVTQGMARSYADHVNVRTPEATQRAPENSLRVGRS